MRIESACDDCKTQCNSSSLKPENNFIVVICPDWKDELSVEEEENKNE